MTSNYIQRKPIKFTPLFKEKIWGGHNLASILHKKLPSDKIGESWEISALSPDISLSSDGKSLAEIIDIDPVAILGERLSNSDFPLLYKFIDARENLSIQVHPSDKIEKGIEIRGKTECWYIVDTEPDSRIIVGFKEDVSREIVRKAVSENTLPDYLDMISVKKGDVLFIPAGTVHAILGGTVIYELQESSDVTYRLYDWGRVNDNGKGRELHVNESLDALNFKADKNYLIEPVSFEVSDSVNAYLRAECSYFNLEEWILNGEGNTLIPAKDVYTVLTLLEGNITIYCADGELLCTKGETVLIPANCQKSIKIEWKEDSRFLYSYVP